MPKPTLKPIARRCLLALVKKKAAVFYAVVAVAVYVWIIAWVVVSRFLTTEIMPVGTLLALFTLPLTVRAIKGALHNDDPSRLIPGMAANVMTMLLTQFLMGIGFILGRVF